ncbi:MAG TPA: hypothetical protein VG455_04295 [Acidimicrobiales bacterium]|nr:hypothetical protein [Acidimicrobiales bacterium]
MQTGRALAGAVAVTGVALAVLSTVRVEFGLARRCDRTFRKRRQLEAQ